MVNSLTSTPVATRRAQGGKTSFRTFCAQDQHKRYRSTKDEAVNTVFNMVGNYGWLGTMAKLSVEHIYFIYTVYCMTALDMFVSCKYNELTTA